MQAKTYLSTLSLSSILLISTLLPLGFFSPVVADSTNEETTLYFKEALQSIDINDMSNFDPFSGFDSETGMFINMSDLRPTKSTDSFYPPKLINGFQLNINETISWFTLWMIEILLESEGIGDISELFEELGLSGFELIFPHPLRIVEQYTYFGNTTMYFDDAVEYNLYFSTPLSAKINKNDQVKVSIYKLENLISIEELGNSTINLSSERFSGFTSTSIQITNITEPIRPNETLLFSIELVPGDKPLTNMIQNESNPINRLINVTYNGLKNFAENFELTNISNIFVAIDEVINLSKEFNLTKEDIADVVDSLISTVFVYDSVDHPSSVTLPFSSSQSNNKDYEKYYLHADESMNPIIPTSSEYTQTSFLDQSIQFNGPVLSRNKILKSAEGYIYLNHMDHSIVTRSMILDATLQSNNVNIASTSITLDKNLAQAASITPYAFSFSIPDTANEIEYGNNLQIQLSLQNTSTINLNLFRDLDLIYDGSQYKSFLSVSYEDTDHISIDGYATPASTEIIPTDSVVYTLNISCARDDNITLQIKDGAFSTEEQNFWDVTISPESVLTTAGQNVVATVTLTSTINSLLAYDEDALDIEIEAIGNTGYDSFPLTAVVSENAVSYDFFVHVPPEKKIRHGTTATYSFIVVNNNTGLWPGRYIFDATSEHFNDNLTVEPPTYNDLGFGNETVVNITMFIPKGTTIEKDQLTFRVISKQTDETLTIILNTTIIGETFFESFYDYFKGISEDLGLDDMFGSSAPLLLIGLIALIIFIIIIFIIWRMRAHYARLVCLNRIAEIPASEHATYEITIENPTKNPQQYQLRTMLSETPTKWHIDMKPSQINIPPHQKQKVIITVEPTDQIETGDWTEITVIAQAKNHKKVEKITLMTSIEDSPTELEIKEVMHWPKAFQEKDRVQTSFRIYNKTPVKTDKVSISLHINGREKNKVEDIVIPALGFADITIPWIAEKGKNKLGIVVS